MISRHVRFHRWYLDWISTFALHPLAEEALQQPLAELTHGRPSVGVDGERVRDFDPAQDHLLHPDGSTAQQGVPLARAQQGALLREEPQKEDVTDPGLMVQSPDIS